MIKFSKEKVLLLHRLLAETTNYEQLLEWVLEHE